MGILLSWRRDMRRFLREGSYLEEHVDVEVYFDVWRLAMAAIADAAFPLRVASAFKLEDHEAFGFLAMSCETFGRA
jgi:Arabinose-binding domain of AraC transcription regulator, N-term